MRKAWIITGLVLCIVACNFPAVVAARQTPTSVFTEVLTQSPTSTPPPTGTPIVLTATPTATMALSSDRAERYVVKEGDTLYQIATDLGIPYEYLLAKNNIQEPNLIIPGQVIAIPSWPPPTPMPQSNSGREILVQISTQQTCAFENGKMIKCVLVSTGLDGERATPIGKFSVYAKSPSIDMEGPGYALPNVPWNLCFLQTGLGYCIHGTYWHNNFGQKMSHGCVNLTIEDAKWFYHFAEVGTPVIVIE